MTAHTHHKRRRKFCWTAGISAVICLVGRPGPEPASAQTTGRDAQILLDRGTRSATINADDDALVDDDNALAPIAFDLAAAKAFAAPPEAAALTKNANLWIDKQRHRVYVDGYVAIRNGPLEMFACPVGTKEHESIVATLSRSREVHAALLAIDASPGTPVRYDPEFLPPTGQSIRVWVLWRDPQGKFHAQDARQWIVDGQTKQVMDVDWVFGGSGFWEDPADGREYYMADGGDMICVSNFSSAMMDVPFSSSADAGDLMFIPNTEKIPERGTPVRLVLVPIPIPTDKPGAKPNYDPNQPPAETYLPPATEASAPATDAKSDADKPAATSDESAGDESAASDTATTEPVE